VPVSRIAAWTRSGLLSPERSPSGDLRYGFQDIVLLRAARRLVDAEVPIRRVRRALESLRDQLPVGRPLSALRLSARGSHVLVEDERGTWEADSGQLQLGLDQPVADERFAARAALIEPVAAEVEVDSAEAARAWFERALDLEQESPAEAMTAYRRALDVDPEFADAHLNLGRLLHEDGDPGSALDEYLAAAGCEPSCARARYNVGVALEDLGRPDEAIEAYGAALALEQELATAHFNLARLLEARGRNLDALQHLAASKRLLDLGEAAR
jgi:tetratricopeptide (TPR) repeat protein